MARITKEARRHKKELLDNYIWELFKENGWSAITYQRLADKLETTKSTIQRYYPSQADFLDGIEGRAFAEMLPHMDTTSVTSFVDAWSDMAVKMPMIHYHLELVVMDGISGLNHTFGINAANRWIDFIMDVFSLDQAQAEKHYTKMLGDAILRIMRLKSEPVTQPA